MKRYSVVYYNRVAYLAQYSTRRFVDSKNLYASKNICVRNKYSDQKIYLRTNWSADAELT